MPRRGDIDRRALGILAWIGLHLAFAGAVSRAGGLDYVQAVPWPTNLYAFAHGGGDPVDVAVIGSSRATFGLPSGELGDCLSRRLGRRARAVNLARVSANAFAHWKTVENLLVPPRQPRAVVVEVADEVVARDFFRMRWVLENNTDLEDVPRCLARAPTWDFGLACTSPLTHGAQALALQVSGRFARRGPHMVWMMTYQGGGQYLYDAPDTHGYMHAYQAQLAPRWDRRSAGLEEDLLERFRGYRVGEGLAAYGMERLGTWATERGVALVLLDMPVNEAFQRHVPEAATRSYRAWLDAFAARHGATLVRPDGKGPALAARDNWIDPDHLSPKGARTVTRALCEETLSPMLGGTPGVLEAGAK